jgi:SPP1 gp7 family putative phage head morphogenesis protein
MLKPIVRGRVALRMFVAAILCVALAAGGVPLFQDASFAGADQGSDVRALAAAVYGKVYAQSSPEANSDTQISLLETDAFSVVLASLDKAKIKLAEEIYEAFHAPPEETSETQKLIGGLIAALLLAAALAVVLSGCEDAKEKAEAAAKHAAALADIEAIRDALRAQGVTEYEIIASGNENMCERCAEMNGKVFPLDEMEIGVNAPPFHPNCDCSIMERVGADAEETDENGKPPIPPEGILGDRTEKNIAQLHPFIQEDARMALYEMQQTFGTDHMRVVEGYRSPAKSDAVSADGYGVAGGKSNHNYGLAFDIGFFNDDGKYLQTKEDDPELFDKLALAGEIGKKYGFEWGGEWTSPVDLPHFQMPYGYTWQELMKLPLLEGSDYLRAIDPSRKYQSQPNTSAESKPPLWVSNE